MRVTFPTHLIFFTSSFELYSAKSSRKEALHYAVFFMLLLGSEERNNACTSFGGRARKKRLLRKIRRMWEDNIKINISEIRLGCMDSNHVAQNRGQWKAVVNTAMKLHVHKM
jgi:hypothetical protein